MDREKKVPSNTSSDRLPTIRVEVENVKRTPIKARITQDKSAYARLARRTEPYKSLPNKFRPALEQVADYYRRVIMKRVFKQEGPGWVGLSQRTQRERQSMGFKPAHPILQRTGDLMRELTERSHPSHVEVIRVGKNARIEIGGSSKKFIENQTGYSPTAPNLPQRQMLPGAGSKLIEQGDKIEMRRIINRVVKQTMKKKSG